jgi:hypothetical protein
MPVAGRGWKVIGGVVALLFFAPALLMHALASNSHSEKFRRTECQVATCDPREKVRFVCEQHPNTEVVELDRGRDFPKSRYVCDEP